MKVTDSNNNHVYQSTQTATAPNSGKHGHANIEFDRTKYKAVHFLGRLFTSSKSTLKAVPLFLTYEQVKNPNHETTLLTAPELEMVGKRVDKWVTESALVKHAPEKAELAADPDDPKKTMRSKEEKRLDKIAQNRFDSKPAGYYACISEAGDSPVKSKKGLLSKLNPFKKLANADLGRDKSDFASEVSVDFGESAKKPTLQRFWKD